MSRGFELQDSPRWSSSGHDKSIYGSELAGRLDFNQHTEGGIAPPCPANTIAPIYTANMIAPIYCLKSKAPSNKEINAYYVQGL